MSQQLSYEQLALAQVQSRETTDYRFAYWTYVGWTILTFGFYGHYATFKLVERRAEHAKRRLAFMSYLWHALNAKAEAAGRRKEVAEGLDNLSRIYQQVETFERRNTREPVLWMLLRIFIGVIGAYINHFLNKDLIFLDTWEDSYFSNVEWVMQRLGYPVSIPKRTRRVPDRSTGVYVVASIFTAGIFTLYWRYTVMMDGNAHFDDDAAAEDAILRAMGLTAPSQLPLQSMEPPGTPAS